MPKSSAASRDTAFRGTAARGTAARGTTSGGAVVGVDEVGRGALFGPVITAAVILSPESTLLLQAAGLTDSKQLSPKQRDRLDEQIRRSAIAWSLGFASVAEIDRWNILQASLRAMARAVAKLLPPAPIHPDVVPSLCLVDGNHPIPNLGLEQRCIIGGDRLEPAIAAASILAKVWRDRLIERLAANYPGHYDLIRNKGYGTAKHRAALQALGPTPQHRRSFAPCHPPAPDYAQLQLLSEGYGLKT